MCTLHYMPIAPCKVSLRPQFSPPLLTSASHPPPFPSAYHHTIICIYMLCECVSLPNPFTFFHPAPNVFGLLDLFLFCFVASSHPNECEVYLIAVWISSSPMISDAEHLFICILPMCVSSLENCLFNFLTHF